MDPRGSLGVRPPRGILGFLTIEARLVMREARGMLQAEWTIERRGLSFRWLCGRGKRTF